MSKTKQRKRNNYSKPFEKYQDLSKEIKINKVILAVERQGKNQGKFSTHIFLCSCNLHCSYCNTERLNKQGEITSVTDILTKCRQLGSSRVVITGGEPLIQTNIKHLLYGLLMAQFEVNIETNGSVDVSVLGVMRFFKKLHLTLDYKMYNSGCFDSLYTLNILKLMKKDVLTCRLEYTENELQHLLYVVNHLNCKATVYIDDASEQLTTNWVTEFLILRNSTNLILQRRIEH